jgi:hypothetical protein
MSGGGNDSTKNTPYPQLLGGNAKAYTGSGSTSDTNNSFFSRSPGDMDLIADPFRVSKTFSAASYSPSPAPAPFLTDFSKFQ